MTTRRRRLRNSIRRHMSRDTVLFLGGLAGIVYETGWDHADKPTLLILFAAMIGLPAFLHGDERFHKDDPKTEPPKTESKPAAEVEK